LSIQIGNFSIKNMPIEDIFCFNRGYLPIAKAVPD
jgi:hypothetical protein